MIKDFINIEQLKKVVKHKTAVAQGAKPALLKDPSEKALYIQEQINRYTSSALLKGILANIFSKILGERIEAKCTNSCSSSYIAGTMIVPLTKEGGHNYPLNKPVFMDKSIASGIRLDGCIGNTLPRMDIKNVRYATDEEIDCWFDEVNYAIAIGALIAFVKKLGC
jgi:hypothetical protein